MGVKEVRSEGMGQKACVHCSGKNIRINIQYFFHLVLFFPMDIFVNYLSSVYCCHLTCIVVILCVLLSSYVYCCHLMCICFILCVFVVPYMYLFYLMCICFTMCVLISSYVYCCHLMCIVVPYVYLLHYVCIAVLTSDAGLLARSQYPEGPATGHVDTGFSRFPCVYKRMLRQFPICYYMLLM
jgi:uncharacterized membrane protein